MERIVSRGERNIRWIERFCFDHGQSVKLTPEQQEMVRYIYDHPDGLQPITVTGPLAAYLALVHLCSHEALQQQGPQPRFETNIFTITNAISPALSAVLKRVGDCVVCPELGTRWA
jgi:hypothetical protein